MRFIQDPKTNQLVPAEEYYAPRQQTHAVHDDLQPFISPVDGSVIGSQRQLRSHNDRHGVVSQAEYGGTHNEDAMRKRHDHFQGKHSKADKLARKQEIYENIMRAERANE